MSRRIIAQYSESLFDIALEQNSVDKYYKEIDIINKVLLNDKTIRDIFSSVIVNSKSREEILQPILKKYEFSLVIINFILILNRHNRISLLSEICKAYLNLIDKQQNIAKTTIITAHPLVGEEKSNLIQSLSKHLQKKLIISECIVDANLLAGAIVKFDNFILDASLSCMINRYMKSIA